VSGLPAVLAAIGVACIGEGARRCNLRVYDVHAYRSHQCAHGRALTQSCGECRCDLVVRAAARLAP
jgi:hypothetical protein